MRGHRAVKPLLSILAFVAGVVAQTERSAEVQTISQAVCPDSADFTNLLQAEVTSSQRNRAAGLVRFLLGHGAKQNTHQPKAANANAQPLLVHNASDSIPLSYFSQASKILGQAGMSTPMPPSALINAPPPKPTPLPWEQIMLQPQQPLSTKIGSAVMQELDSAISGSLPETPPPSQASTEMQFVAKCPMVIFKQNLSIRAPSCKDTHGRWEDPNPLNPRTVLRWDPLQAGGIRLGVDSSMAGEGAALFANVHEVLTLKSYEFVMKNCLGVDRWTFEEEVFEIDNMGRADATIDAHDIEFHSIAYFFRYSIKSPAGILVAQSSLYRLEGTKQVNFSQVQDGQLTGILLAVATKQGKWEGAGWKQCMSSASPRGWNIHFPEEEKKQANETIHATMATVQDLRIAIAGAITLMAHRDENRGRDGLNKEGSTRQGFMLAGLIALVCMAFLLLANFCMVFVGSGIKAKLRKLFFDTEGAMMPKRASQIRKPPLHTAW